MQINLTFIAFIILAIFMVVLGRKRGLVKSVISLISTIILSIIAVLVLAGIKSYNNGSILVTIAAVVLGLLVITAYAFLRVIFFSAKMLAKLPVISFADKRLGAVFGLVEAFAILWLVFAFAGATEIGGIGQMISSHVANNAVLAWLASHNYLIGMAKNLAFKNIGSIIL